MVNCIYVAYPASESRNTLFVLCFFRVHLWADYPIYAQGKTASNCTTGLMPNYDGLCCVYENIEDGPKN